MKRNANDQGFFFSILWFQKFGDFFPKVLAILFANQH
jgi:hypothetical protein